MQRWDLIITFDLWGVAKGESRFILMSDWEDILVKLIGEPDGLYDSSDDPLDIGEPDDEIEYIYFFHTELEAQRAAKKVTKYVNKHPRAFPAEVRIEPSDDDDDEENALFLDPENENE